MIFGWRNMYSFFIEKKKTKSQRGVTFDPESTSPTLCEKGHTREEHEIGQRRVEGGTGVKRGGKWQREGGGQTGLIINLLATSFSSSRCYTSLVRRAGGGCGGRCQLVGLVNTRCAIRATLRW